jgi:tetratricopeptide (TPR) repeat protein
VGWGAFLVSAVSAVGSVFTSTWFTELVGASGAAPGWHSWFLVIGIVSVVVAIVLVGWLRFWVRASRTPFHYTYSIETFNPVEGTTPQDQLAWLPHDLSKRLSERIGRLSLLDERYSGETEAPEAHIHLGGAYGVRMRGDRERVVEVMPWVRLGPTGSPAKLAHAVSFRSDRDLDAASYEKLVERVYFSVATRIYRQIRDDVQRKINLLPRRYFRAAAYFYEAEDYLRSNTLHAYEQAHRLYAAAVRLYAPIWGEPASGHSAGLIVRSVDRLLARWSLFWRRRLLAWLWPGLCRIEVMVARAELGYARTLVYRRTVAGLSGQRLNPVFAARPVADRAVKRLTRLRKDVPGRRKRLFDAHVTKAAVLAELGSYDDAGECLEEARAIDPARSEQNAFYMYVQGRVETRQRSYFFQRAGELLPSFEVAQFERAIQTELVWRRRPAREANVAEIVARDYERVLELNPGNVAAWANLGYMYWLLGEHDEAEQALLRGREYKEIRHETFVAELDYTLARVAAETGDFARAYSHYVDAVAGHVAQGVAPEADGYTGYQFLGMPRWMLDRFRQYRLCVKRHWLDARDLPDPAPDGTTRRVRAAVYKFVLNDYGEACVNYWLRSGDQRYFRIARHAFEEALHGQLSLPHAPKHGLDGARPQTRNPVVSFNLNRLRRWEVEWIDTSEWARSDHEELALRAADKLLEFRPRDTHIDRALTYEPRWTEGLLEKAWSDMVLARQSRAVANVLEQFAVARTESAKELKAVRRQVPEFERPIDPRERELKLKLTGSAAAAATRLPASRTEQKREESKALLDRAEELEEKAKNLRSAAKAFDSEACATPERLLPHQWLRRGGAFDWGAAKRRALKRRRLWERELDVPQVWAIFALCEAELTRLEGEETHAARKSRGRVWSMLALLRERFWPDRLELLSAAEDFPGRKAEDNGDLQVRKRRVVTRWCELDPSFRAFQWLSFVEPRRDRIDGALEATEDGLRADLEKGLRSSLRRRFPMRRPRLATSDVESLVKTLHESHDITRFLGTTIEEVQTELREAEADPRLLAELIVSLVPPVESDHRAAAYREIRDLIAERAGKGEEAGTALVEIADLRSGLSRASQDPRSLYERICTALRRHGTSQGVATAAQQADIADFVSKTVELLRTMYGDRGVPPSLYAQIGDALYARGDKQGAMQAYARRPDSRPPLELSAGRRTMPVTARRERRNASEDPPTLRGIGRVHWSEGRYKEAFDQFRAIRRRADGLESGWRSKLAADLLAEQSGETADAAIGYRLFKNWLGRELTTARGPTPRRSDERSLADVADAASAVLRVTKDRYMEAVHRRENARVIEAARPLAQAVLEAHPGFFMDGEKVRGNVVEALIYERIPQCRNETESDVGVVLPPVLIQASWDIAPESYCLHVEGVPTEMKTFASNEVRFLPADAERLDGAFRGESRWNPRGGSGLWVEADDSVGQQGWDRYDYMVEHLRAVLLARPDGLPLASRAIDLYKDSSGRAADQDARVRLAAVIRALLRERVTTFDLRAVVEAFVAADPGLELRDVVEEVRMAVSESLPGADGSLRLFTLPPELEDRIRGLVRGNTSSGFLAASRAEATELLSDLGEALDGLDGGAALVVLRPRLRPFVRTLVAYRHPALPVLAYTELPMGSMALVQPEAIA